MAFKKRNDESNKNKGFAYSPISSVTALIILASIMIIAAFFCLIFVTDVAVKGYSDPNEFYILCAMLAVAFVCIVAIILVADYLYQRSNAKRSSSKRNVTETADLPLGVLAVLHQPVAVCDEDGKIFWMNRSFATQSSKHMLLSENINLKSVLDFRKSEFKGESIDALKLKLKGPEYDDEDRKRELPSPSTLTTKETIDWLISHNCGVTASGQQGFGGDWTIRAYSFESAGINYYIMVFTEDTEYNKLHTKYNDELAHVAYIAVDNLAELAQSDQNNYRNASAQVAASIKKWAMDHCAFLKEFERDKYVAFITSKELSAVEKGRFQLLEKVSATKINNESPVTVSVGVSPSFGTFEEKEKFAQSALEMALQRGGNQAVVMYAKDQQRFYGAKTITSLQRSGVRHRVFADKLIKKLNECSNVVIMGHKGPDYDALGSCLGIARLAISVKGKDKVSIVVPQNDQNFRDCKELLKGISEYDGVFVDAEKGLNSVKLETLVICSDVNNPRNFEYEEIYKSANNFFIIDHHRQSEFTPKPKAGSCEILIVPSASSASELISEILELELPAGCRLTPEEATIMFAGIMLDTKNFTRNTQVHTFGAAIYLKNHGADPAKAQSLFRVDFESFRRESSFASDLEVYKESMVIAKERSSESSPEKRITAAKTADKLLNIKNSRASFVIARMGNDVFISARSDGSINVQLIMEKMGGGGHYNAAATWIKEANVDDTANRLKESIDLYFGDVVSPEEKDSEKTE
ncbi:MAG: hypothetical protein E7634_08195 [Ruminococcaceae bacterium]|nr:hypothetical protein [Oscillospiraceae bacterium]